MKNLNKIKSISELTVIEMYKVNGGSAISGPGDAAYSLGYGAVINQVMLFGGVIPAGYLTYKWAKRMFS